MGQIKRIGQRIARVGRVWQRENDGFLLPVVIALGVAISTVSVLALQGVAQNSVTTNNNYYNTLAHEAALAGKAMANSCISASTIPVRTAAQPLQVNTDCAGVQDLTKPNYVAKSDNYISYFKVAPFENPTTKTIVFTSKGYVDFLRPDGTVAKSQAFNDSVRTLKRSTPQGNISKDVDDLSIGFKHTCVAAEGQAYCWGDNSSGQLGAWNNTANSNLPVEVDVNTIPAPAIPCTNGIGCILGNNNSKPVHPVSPLAGKAVTKVAAGNTHSCALTSEGKVYCWGSNDYGQLGNRTNTDSPTPVAVDTSPVDIPAITGQPLGCIPNFPTFLNGCVTQPVGLVPKSAIANKRIVDIQTGNNYTCALADDGSMGCWGDNGVGQLGTTDRSNRNYPVAPYTSNAKPAVAAQPTGCTPAGGFLDFLNPCSVQPSAYVPPTPLYNKKVIKLGSMSNNKHTCVIAEDNLPYCWGQNYGGQVGNDVSHATESRSSNSSCPSPPAITYDNDALEPKAVYMGGVTSTTTSTWFGLWSTTSTRPASALQGSTVTDIAESSTYTTARGTDGDLFWWGGNSTTSQSCQTKQERQSDGTYKTVQSGDAHRYYNIMSRPDGPMFSSNRTCYFVILSFPCGDISNVQGKKFSLFTGNANTGTFCGQTSSDIYCQAASANSFSAYGATQCNYIWGYHGQLGTGDGPGLPQLNYPCWTTNPVRVKMDGWLTGKGNPDELRSGSATDYLFIFSNGTQQGAYSCVLVSKQVGCWGDNEQGQLGTGDNADRNEPTPVSVDSPLGKPGGAGGNYGSNVDF